MPDELPHPDAHEAVLTWAFSLFVQVVLLFDPLPLVVQPPCPDPLERLYLLPFSQLSCVDPFTPTGMEPDP